MGKFLITEEFVLRARKVHGDKYGYSMVKYKDINTPVNIKCSIHGVFMQVPRKHLEGCGCPSCGSGVYTTNTFIKRCKELYGSDYDFSKVRYNGSRKKVKVVCNRCGTVFYKTPNAILFGTKICKFCDGSGQVRNTTQFILKAKEVHGNQFDYSTVVYVNSHTPVKIICKEHGEFLQRPNVHLRGGGCHKCCGLFLSNDEYIAKAKKIHGETYDYSLVSYHGCMSKIKIICPTHGVFVQNAHNHLQGQGCPICKSSHGERKIYLVLTNANIGFVTQYKFPNENLFCNRVNLVVDFYLPQYNSIIEFHGEQHYEPIKWFGGEQKFKQQEERDIALRQYCKDHKIKLIEIPYWKYNNIEAILKKELKIK